LRRTIDKAVRRSIALARVENVAERIAQLVRAAAI